MIPATITRKTLHNSTKYLSLIVKPSDPSYSWIAGQWIDVTTTHFYNKNTTNITHNSHNTQPIPVAGYSFCSPTGYGDFELLLRKSNHLVTEWIFENINREREITLLIGKASGDVQYNSKIHKNIICIAGGVGITPLISMIRTQKQYQNDTTAQLYHCIKSKEDALFSNEFTSKDTVFISEENNKINFGDIAIRHGTDVDYFICGPTFFIDNCVSDLKSHGCHNVHFEKWW